MLYMFTMMMMLLTNNIIMISMHPLMMTLLIIFQTLLLSLMLGMMSYSYWFSYILFLIFLGGMLVLFMYITSLASNDKFEIPFSSTKISMSIITTLMIVFIMYSYMWLSFNNNKSDSMTTNMMICSNENPLNLFQLFNIPNNMITILAISYLFLTLIIIVFITKMNKGPLRKSII